MSTDFADAHPRHVAMFCTKATQDTPLHTSIIFCSGNLQMLAIHRDSYVQESIKKMPRAEMNVHERL
jgi:hypothetical protein